MEREKSIWYENMPRNRWTKHYPECSIFTQLKTNAAEYIDLPALDFQGKQISFRQLIDITEQLAAALLSIGIKKGDIVSIVSANVPQAIYMFYAINRIGAVANMIHPLLPAKQIQSLIEEGDSAAVFVLDAIYPKIASSLSNMDKSPIVIIGHVIDDLPGHLKPFYALKSSCYKKEKLPDNCFSWKTIFRLGKGNLSALPSEESSPQDLAVILYSGGTTGIQKGVMLTNYNFTCYAVQAYEASGMDTIGKKCLAVLPLFHGFGLALCVHTMLSSGACIYLVPVYDFNKCNALIFKKKLNFLCGVPAFFENLSRDPKIEKEDLSFIECLISGGDVLPEKLQKRINRQMETGGSKARIREAYGQTESVTGCCINPDFQIVMGSVGLPCPDIESKVVKIGTCDEVPYGMDGELCLSGPNIMAGYFRNPEATAKVLRRHSDGKIWLHTGDIFYKREDGFLFFRQRLSRMIVCAGYNVYLSQVEDALTDCHIVTQCCAVGLKDRALGSKVGLYVIKSESADEQTARSIITEHCRNHLFEYALPHRIEFIDEFPLTKMGKVDFRTLEDRMNKN